MARFASQPPSDNEDEKRHTELLGVDGGSQMHDRISGDMPIDNQQHAQRLHPIDKVDMWTVHACLLSMLVLLAAGEALRALPGARSGPHLWFFPCLAHEWTWVACLKNPCSWILLHHGSGGHHAPRPDVRHDDRTFADPGIVTDIDLAQARLIAGPPMPLFV